ALASGIAAATRVALFALVHTDENVFCEFRHRVRLQLSQYRGAIGSTNAQGWGRNISEIGLAESFHGFRAELDTEGKCADATGDFFLRIRAAVENQAFGFRIDGGFAV